VRKLVALLVLFAWGEAPLTPEAVLRVAGEMARRRAEQRAAQPGPRSPIADLAPPEPDGPPLSPTNFSHVQHDWTALPAAAGVTIVRPEGRPRRIRLPDDPDALVDRDALCLPRPRGPPDSPGLQVGPGVELRRDAAGKGLGYVRDGRGSRRAS
jgi:hypothetical protein